MMQPNSSASAHSVRQRAEVAVHAEHAVGDEERRAGAAGSDLQDLARRVDVLVRKHLDRRAAQAAAVDDARVVQLVRHDDVVLAEDGRDRAGVGREAALEDDDGFGLLELGEPAFELHVDGHRAGDRPNRSGADAESPRRLERALAQPRMRRQAEVVVRREVDDLRGGRTSSWASARLRGRAAAGRDPASLSDVSSVVR